MREKIYAKLRVAMVILLRKVLCHQLLQDHARYKAHGQNTKQ